MLFSPQVEIEHILPFSQTLDDSLANKTVAMRQANRIKGNRTPWQAKDDFAAQGWRTDDMLSRAKRMPQNKLYRFGENGMEQWSKDDKGFLARALNDTRHLSIVAKAYLSLICPQNTRAIPGRMTAMLRGKFGLNDILGLDGEKNRNDHRHHAVDACVIAVTDQGMLERFAKASSDAREQQLNKLVKTMPMPWKTYREHVQRAIDNIWVSHKPDHSHEGGMHEDTAYRPPHLDKASMWRTRGINGDNPNEREAKGKVIFAIKHTGDPHRHALTPDGEKLPYKGYVGGSNYCIEIVRNDNGKWEGEVISTFEAYQIVQKEGLQRLRHPTLSCSGKPLVMRLMRQDVVRLRLNETDKVDAVLRIAKIGSNGQFFMAMVNEANVDARNSDKSDPFTYVSKTAGSLQKAQGRRVSISPIGELRDPGFTNWPLAT